MIIAYEKLTNSYKDIIKENLFNIGEGFILDTKNNILHKFNSINNVTLEVLEGLNVNKGEIVLIYPCNLRDMRKTLDICVESYIVRNSNFEKICEAIHGCPCTKRNILIHSNIDLRTCNVLF
ncbi:hypothetical protein [uncultured Cetobacterium sp.]|uniref:hypothetical protein n=1 Tax=uncultured Cetobacterium sp. TaxID=527638 RepID=UPI00260BB151|nr:hypothetical protein [uncultured Cetobacterium sp.]